MPQTDTAARRIVDALLVNGIDHVFCVPGESYLAVLDALADVGDCIRTIACRHEAGAANMAEAYGKLTGRPGVCMVTRGPGATHASIGVHTAEQDSTPMLLFVGQVARGDRGRGAFQEVDYRAVFGTLAKWATELDEPERTAEIVGRAFATARQGRKGPVVIALPEDMLHEPGGPPARAVAPARSGFDPEALAAIVARLNRAERPLVVLGGSGWEPETTAALSDWARAHDVPVLCSFRRKDLLDNDHPCYAGDLGLGCNPELAARVKSADLLLAVGARLGENPTQGYTLFDADWTAERLIHVLAGPEEVGRVWPPAVGAVADVGLAARALAEAPLDRRWPEWRAELRGVYEAFSAPVEVTGAVNLSHVFRHLAQVLPADAVVANGAGNFAAWLHRFYRHRACRTQLAPTSGAMGYGFPAAIAAKLARPDAVVVSVSGDGDFLMTAQEMATAVQYGANVIALVIDNGSYGTIRMHQEKHFPGRVTATDLRNPDFAAWAEAHGAAAFTVARTEDFPPALDAARASGKPALIWIKTDVEDIAPGRTLAAVRAG
jgi:acetolactate synthase-1/2/3 large subunit